MKILALLNRDGGRLRTADVDAIVASIKDEFAVHGHQVEVEAGSGEEIVAAIGKAAKRDDLDVLLVGGGDGTVSAATSALVDGRIALGVLPAGTMNLFARTLQIPLDVETAIKALAGGEIVEVDYASVNGKPFTHQFAVGLHARMVRLRKKFSYGSRIGKIIATTRAVVVALRRLPMVKIEIDVDGVPQIIDTPAVAISNNVYGEGHIPFADDPTGGVLGVYICTERKPSAVYRLTFDIMMGAWRTNPSLTFKTAKEVVLRYGGKHRRKRAVQDGELTDLDEETVLKIHPKGLKVLVPAEATFLQGAVSND